MYLSAPSLKGVCTFFREKQEKDSSDEAQSHVKVI